MSTEGMALTKVPTEDLKTMLKELHHERLQVPVTPAGVTALGLQDHLEAVMGSLRGLESSGVRAVLVAVLAERLQ